MNGLGPRLVCVLVLAAGCVSAPRLETVLRAAPPPPAIRFGVDTFAFLNTRGFRSARVYDTGVGPIRAFRMYYGPLL